MRDHYDNLILMCPNHHQLVDRLEPDRFTVEALLAMKQRCEQARFEWRPGDEQLERFSRQLKVSSLILNVAEDAWIERHQAPTQIVLTPGSPKPNDPGIANLRAQFGASMGGGDVTFVPPSQTDGIRFNLQSVQGVLNALLDMRNEFNVQHAAHTDEPSWSAEYNSPEALKRLDLSRRLDVALLPFQDHPELTPVTRALVSTFSWSNTELERAISEVQSLSVIES